MFRLLALCTLLALATAAPNTLTRNPMPDGRIVGGTETTIEKHPFQVSLQWGGSHICGGSLVSPTKVVTAAHCTDGSTADSLSVRVGSSLRNNGGTVINVATIAQNPAYDSSNIDNDSSVLTLATPVELGDKQNVIALGEVHPEENTPSVCTGWGTTSEGGASSAVLQEVTMGIVGNVACAEYYAGYLISDRMMCAGNMPEGGADACQGDSGGPLTIGSGADRQLVGIVSWGIGCARPDFPGVYGSVPGMIEFINQNINN